MSQAPRILVLHDYFAIRGGGEQLVLALCAGLKADLCTAYWTPDSLDCPSDLRVHLLSDKAPQGRGQFFKLKNWFILRTGFMSEYDIFIYSGQCSLFARNKHQLGTHILYCHTPPRYVFDQRTFFRQKIRRSRRWLYDLTMVYIGMIYKQTLHKMNGIVTNAKNIQQRLNKFVGFDSTVIYPPIDTKRFQWINQENYYLSFARLDHLKRVDLIVEAFQKMPEKNLVVISGGPEEKKLRAMAQNYPNIQILGWQSNEQMAQWVGNCIATIYIPIDEDFGMSAVESMAAGKPVIGCAEGGLLETIQDQITGLLINSPPQVADLIQAIQKLDPEKALSMRANCEGWAATFSTQNFITGMQEFIKKHHG